MTYMNGGSICTWGVVNRDPEFGGKNMNCLVNKTQQTTFHGDNKINTADRISFSSKIARNWLAPWRVHLLDELLVLIVTIPRRAGWRRGRVPICECCYNMKDTRSEFWIPIELQLNSRNSRKLLPPASTRRLWYGTSKAGRNGMCSKTGRQFHEFCLARQVPHADNQITI